MIEHKIQAPGARAGELVQQVLSNAERVNSASRDRLTFVEQLAARSRSIGQDISDLREQTGSARQALETATKATKNISGEVEGILATLNDAHEQIGILSNRLSEFQDRFAEVEGVSAAIREVADRTNVLSLNAMIEAARAGEHGKGFGVVAQEVRELADLTGDSANKISSTISELTTGVSGLVDNCSDLERRVEHSSRSGQQSMGVLQTVERSLNDTFSFADSNQAASAEHLLQLTELTGDMVKLKDDTQAAIDGSARNISISRDLASCIEAMQSE